MSTTTVLVGGLFVIVAVLMAALLRHPIRHGGTPGSRGFVITFVGGSIWALARGVNLWTANETITLASHNVVFAASAMVACGWFLIAMEFTSGRLLSIRWYLLVGAVIVVDQVILLTNSVHSLYMIDRSVDGVYLDLESAPGALIRDLFMYVFYVGGTLLYVAELPQSQGLYRRQLTVLLVSGLIGIAISVPYNVGLFVPRYDPIVFAVAFSAVLFWVALFRTHFLDVTPVRRKTIIEEMRDAVVTLDASNRVVDTNRAARKLLDVDGSVTGVPAAVLFESFGEEALETLATTTRAERLVSTDHEGEARFYSMSVSPIQSRGRETGRIVVLRDVTKLKRHERALRTREEELDLLRQVMSRVLRHNIRNDMTVIRGHAKEISNAVARGGFEPDGGRAIDQDIGDRANMIVSVSDELLDISHKSRTIETVIEDGTEQVTVDLSKEVRDVLERLRSRYETTTFDVDAPERCPVVCHSHLGVALENLLENAAEHNEAADPYVSVTIDPSDDVRLVATDNGGGIPAAETAALERGHETPLSHASGVGLWIVTWVLARSGATIEFDSDDTGTVVTVTFSDGTPLTPADAWK